MIQKSAMKLAKDIINITYQIMASIIISLSLSLVTLIVTAVSLNITEIGQLEVSFFQASFSFGNYHGFNVSTLFFCPMYVRSLYSVRQYVIGPQNMLSVAFR